MKLTDDDINEARELLTSLIENIEKDGPYSKEAMCIYLRQALLCLETCDWPDGDLPEVQMATPRKVELTFKTAAAAEQFVTSLPENKDD